MSERWKPKTGELYYYFDHEFDILSDLHINARRDEKLTDIGNCFRTRAEAESAAEKIKALLLSLHESTQDNQLPKLTAEVFDRPDCPEWAKYAAVDSNGAGYYYSEKPFILSDAFCWGIVCSETNQSVLISGVFNNSDWQNSLIERPANLPAWCKVGEWVLDSSNYKYVKVDSTGANYANVSDEDIGIGYMLKIENMTQARLRPYNADEMKALVGKVIATKEDCAIVTGYRGCENKIILTMEHNRYSADELLKINATTNGKPCGVFEHLENGEWVE